VADKTLPCPECDGRLLRKKAKGDKPFYGCENWPRCRGSHGAHPDGSPLGIPADAETKRMRHAAHEVFDSLWKEGPLTRKGAYVWMRQALGMTVDEAHIGNFDIATCKRLIKAVWEVKGE
jgi:ssDNA-binding Zn-finger/Zn-ribbon topoisomerase 1